MAVALGHSGWEIFPKQDKILSERGDVGNFINLPYFNAELPQRYCFNKKGEAMELEEFIEYIQKIKVPISKLEKTSVSGKRKYFTDGPHAWNICLLMNRVARIEIKSYLCVEYTVVKDSR